MKEQNSIEIYQSKDKQTVVEVKFDKETVWLNRQQLAVLFDRDIKTIGKHINNVFKEGELDKISTVAKFATVQKEGNRIVERYIEHYNLDVVISVGYRVKSMRGTQFRIWATQRLKDYLVKGYAINEKRLKEKQQEILHLKTGIQILCRAIEAKNENNENEILNLFAKGLELLDDYLEEENDAPTDILFQEVRLLDDDIEEQRDELIGELKKAKEQVITTNELFLFQREII